MKDKFYLLLLGPIMGSFSIMLSAILTFSSARTTMSFNVMVISICVFVATVLIIPINILLRRNAKGKTVKRDNICFLISAIFMTVAGVLHIVAFIIFLSS